ncbi:expressed unknown protein [Seminavis robusta]|uniref:Uncharacterized protein n=1 Tax=Seminavis robusta TaxID=568900 RepID=A0A9N8HNB3_9STRA|nr:expressed unknown protein [Seminavis robusta]|eukprot:Sro807_g205320.1 n/a (299) ;mRNA; f:39518-40414
MSSKDSSPLAIILFILVLLVHVSSRVSAAKPLVVAFQNQPLIASKLQDLSSPPEEWTLQWVEDTSFVHSPFQVSSEEEDEIINKPPRRILWMGRMDDRSYDPSYYSSRQAKAKLPQASHPLRMEQWNLTLAWKEERRQRDKILTFEFNENGYVRSRHPNRAKNTYQQPPKKRQYTQQYYKKKLWKLLPERIQKRSAALGILAPPPEETTLPYFVAGTWKLAPSGVTWNMRWDGKTYHFFADLHANPFGRHPKMFRGIVMRDRRSFPLRLLFRPIVATFSGRGVGADTADFTYKSRGGV